MEIRHFQTFVVAAETQSFTRTAQIVGLTQSAISQHIGILEKELGRSLFDRGPNSIELTEFGSVLYHNAQRILSIVNEIKQKAGHKENEISGLVTIADSSVPAEWLLPELLLIIRNAYPHIQESVKVSDSVQAIKEVESGNVDFALVGELPRADNLCSKRVAEDELVLVVAPDHPLVNVQNVLPSRLLDCTFIFREPGSASRQYVEHALSNAGLSIRDLNIPMEVNSNDAIRAAVERSVGISFLSKRAIARELSDERLVIVDIDGVKIIRNLYLVTDPRRLPNSTVRTVLGLVDDYRKEMFDSG